MSAQNCCILSTSMSLTFDGSLYSGKSLFLIFSYDVAGEAGNNYVLICMVWTRVIELGNTMSFLLMDEQK